MGILKLRHSLNNKFALRHATSFSGANVRSAPVVPGFDLPEHLFDAYLSEGLESRPRAGSINGAFVG